LISWSIIIAILHVVISIIIFITVIVVVATTITTMHNAEGRRIALQHAKQISNTTNATAMHHFCLSFQT
jgi:hypothetical protein